MRRSRRYRRLNAITSLSTGEKVALVAGGVTVLGVVGYLIYNASSGGASATTPSPGVVTLGSGGSTSTLPQNETGYLGSGGSQLPLSQTSTGNDFEAGAGANAPLQATAS